MNVTDGGSPRPRQGHAMTHTGWKDWAEVFNFYVAKGEDHASAALRADIWDEHRYKAESKL